MEWLVTMQFTVPQGTSGEGVDGLRQQEAAAAAALAAEGKLVRLWRIPGRWANWGVWSAADAGELHAVLSSLPLYPWAEVDVYPLAPHPNDPAHSG